MDTAEKRARYTAALALIPDGVDTETAQSEALEALYGTGAPYPGVEGNERRTLAFAADRWRRCLVTGQPKGDEYSLAVIRTDAGMGWSWAEPSAAWCGAAAADFVRCAWGLTLTPERYDYFPSTYRLVSDRPKELGPRYAPIPAAVSSARPGCIVIVGNPADKYSGHHITCAVDVDEYGVGCIGGNQSGVLPGGRSRVTGVVYTRYPWPENAEGGAYRLMWVIPVLEAQCSADVMDTTLDVEEALRWLSSTLAEMQS